MTFPLAARAAVTTKAERSVSSGMPVPAPSSAVATASPAVLRATGSSPTALVTAKPARGAGTPYAAASLSADAVAAFTATALAPTATSDDDAIDQVITALPNIGRAATTESIFKSVAVHAAVGATIKSAGDPGRLPTDEDRQRFSEGNRNNRENATAASAGAACGTANNDGDLRHGVRYAKRLFCTRIEKRVTVRRGAAFSTYRRHADRRL